LSKTIETASSDKIASQKSVLGKAVVEAGGAIPFLSKLRGEVEVGGEHSSEKENLISLREVQTTSLHDASFDVIQDYIKYNCAFEEDEPDVGSLRHRSRHG